MIAGQVIDDDASVVDPPFDVTRDDLEALAGLRNLRKLHLDSTEITDDHLEPVGRLTGLENLDISACDITDAGIHHLRGLTNLRHLRMKETLVTDVGIGHLAPMRALETLNIRELDITDASLRHLAGHPRLTLVAMSDGLAEGRFSYAALAELQERLPGCELLLVGRGIFPEV